VVPALRDELVARFRGAPEYAARWAALPEGSEPLENPLGGAPGFRLVDVWVLPGLPREMEAMFDRYADAFAGGPPIEAWRARYRTGESAIADLLEEATERWPQVSVGSYPTFPPDGPEVEVVLKSADAAALAEARGFLEPRLRDR
jgi:molybdopterin-biosynthesis enzyme MoeA-like protein